MNVVACGMCKHMYPQNKPIKVLANEGATFVPMAFEVEIIMVKTIFNRSTRDSFDGLGMFR